MARAALSNSPINVIDPEMLTDELNTADRLMERRKSTVVWPSWKRVLQDEVEIELEAA